jgi:hypothetical protein
MGLRSPEAASTPNGTERKELKMRKLLIVTACLLSAVAVADVNEKQQQQNFTSCMAAFINGRKLNEIPGPEYDAKHAACTRQQPPQLLPTPTPHTVPAPSQANIPEQPRVMESPAGIRITIKEEITKDTVAWVKQALNNYTPPKTYIPPKDSDRPWIFLESPGGDIDASLELGRFFREKRIAVIANECASACIFVLAGAPYRISIFGKVGIHRPYFTDTTRSVTVDNVQVAMDRTKQELRDYLREMNISERLVDDMMVTPPSRMKWLTKEELLSYGLGTSDPVYLEADALAEAKKYGLSRQEYEQRNERSSDLCKPDYSAYCHDKVMRGQL